MTLPAPTSGSGSGRVLRNRTSGERDANQPQVRDQTEPSVPQRNQNIEFRGGGTALSRPVALVTGAGRGIGRQIAVRLDEQGFRLGLTARSGKELADTAELLRSPAVCVAGDVRVAEDVARICAVVEDRLGPVDVLVNNAGYFGHPGRFVTADLAEWWRVLETNLLGPAQLDRRVLPGMLARRRGRLITLNSQAAVRDGEPDLTNSAYSVSKAAALRLDAALAHELAGSGVAVFSVSPGLVHTGMSELRPDFASIPKESFLPASAAADMVAALASGRYDRLHGRFLHARDDLDALLAAIERQPTARTLGVEPVAAIDLVFG
jgi:3-oxoacyl-[acyl-carrier protein] reductase